MRALALALLLTTAACSKVPQEAAAAATPAAITFDGAQVTNTAARVAHGDRLTQVLGCKGCHTPTLTGQNFLADAPELGAVYASNLTQVIPHYTDGQLLQILRRGVHPTRKNLWIMPAEVFQHLGNADMAALLAYLRTLKPAGTATPAPRFTALGSKIIASGKVKPVAQYVSEYRLKQPVDLGPKYALGRYITSVTCAECHGADLTGIPDFEKNLSTPNLIVAGGYTRADFERLMTTGVPVGGRKLRVMDNAAKRRFSMLTSHERDALYAYLKARAEQSQ